MIHRTVTTWVDEEGVIAIWPPQRGKYTKLKETNDRIEWNQLTNKRTTYRTIHYKIKNVDGTEQELTGL